MLDQYLLDLFVVLNQLLGCRDLLGQRSRVFSSCPSVLALGLNKATRPLTGNGNQVFSVCRQEPVDGSHCFTQPFNLMLHGIEVVETVCHVLDQGTIEFGQARTQSGRKVFGVQLAGQVGASQGEKEINQGAVASGTKSEQSLIDGGAKLLSGGVDLPVGKALG